MPVATPTTPSHCSLFTLIDATSPLPYNPTTMPVDSESVPLGAQAPDFTLTAVDGNEVTLSELGGKPVVLVFLRGFF